MHSRLKMVMMMQTNALVNYSIISIGELQRSVTKFMNANQYLKKQPQVRLVPVIVSSIFNI